MSSETIDAREPRPAESPESQAQALDRAPKRVSLARGLTAGLIGGLSGTVAMDLVVLAMYRTVGAPRSASLDTISDSAAAIFSKAGVDLAGSKAIGPALHILIGSGLGVAFGGGLTRIRALREASQGTIAGLGALYALVATQPLVAAAAVALKMPRADAAKWYGITFLTHTIFGSVLGAVAGYGLRSSRGKGG